MNGELYLAAGKTSRRIMDYGASDHMTSSLTDVLNVVPADTGSQINLPTGVIVVITHK